MISELLKTHTKKHHDLVEERFHSNKIFNGTFTLEDYKNLIKYNYLFLLNYENLVFNSISKPTADALNLEQRRKLHLAENDADRLNIPKLLPECQTIIKNQAEALGILYVMEGSTLGGNVIAKQLLKNPEFKEVSFNYFQCYAENTGPLWKNFKEVLDQTVHPENYDDCINGANRAYDFLLRVS